MALGSGRPDGLNIVGIVLLCSIFVIIAGCADDGPPIMGPSGGPPLSHRSINCAYYLRNRFFQLDLPPANHLVESPDNPGRDVTNGIVDSSSIRIYERYGYGPSFDSRVINADVAVFRDTTGVWEADFSESGDLVSFGAYWNPVDYAVINDAYTDAIFVDLLKEYSSISVLAVTYDVIDQNSGELLYRVGDRFDQDQDQRIDLFGDSRLYYRLKLLKAERSDIDPHTWQYVLRNVYDLGVRNIDYRYFNLSIETDSAGRSTDMSGLPWLQIFGLDQYSEVAGMSGPDNLPDISNPHLFDMRYGLLFFPMSKPFAATQQEYEHNANCADFDWNNSFLPNLLMPEMYNYQTALNSYYRGRFRIKITTAAPVLDFNKNMGDVR